MARVEIAEAVQNTAGAALSGASVQVNIRGGAAATLYAAETGGTTVGNPRTTTAAGQIEAWVEEGHYTLVTTKSGYTFPNQPFEAVRTGALSAPAATGVVATDTANLTAVVATANATGRDLYIPYSTTEYVISSRLTISTAGVKVLGAWPTIRQTTWGQPVFELLGDDTAVERFYLRSTETRTELAPASFRLDNASRFSSGVWGCGNRHRIRGVRCEGFDNAVHLTNWTVATSTKSGVRYGNVVEDINCATVSLGVVCVSQQDLRVADVMGSTALMTGAIDPSRLVYIISTTGLTGGDWDAFNVVDAPFQLKFVTGAAISNLKARACGGLFNYESLIDSIVTGLSGHGDTKADEVGSIAAIDYLSARSRFVGVTLEKPVSGRGIMLFGDDMTMSDVTLRTARPVSNANEDIRVGGNRCKLDGVRHRNVSSTTTGANGIYVGDGADHVIQNYEAKGVRNGILIAAAVTGTTIDVDEGLISPESGFAKVSDGGTGTRRRVVTPVWHEIGGAGEPAFTNSWVNYATGYETAAYLLDGSGVVHLKGTIKNGTLGASAFTLPAGYRPAATVGYGDSTIRIDVTNTGTVTLNGGVNTFRPLDGISFRVA